MITASEGAFLTCLPLRLMSVTNLSLSISWSYDCSVMQAESPASTRRHPDRGGRQVRYLILIEPMATGFSAYCPDVDGCVATATTRVQAESEMHDALQFHIEGLREDGLPVPTPAIDAAYVEISP